MKIKIFEVYPLKKAIEECLEAGYFPATVEEIKEFKAKGLIDKDKWYDTSTITYKNETRKATLKELQNIEEVYKNGGRAWVANSIDNYSGAGGGSYLNGDYGRLVGVAAEPQKKHKGKCCSCVGEGK